MVLRGSISVLKFKVYYVIYSECFTDKTVMPNIDMAVSGSVNSVLIQYISYMT